MLSLLSALEDSFIALPAAVDALTRAATALDKLDRYLDNAEVDKVPRRPAPSAPPARDGGAFAQLPHGAIALNGLSVKWPAPDKADDEKADDDQDNGSACCWCARGAHRRGDDADGGGGGGDDRSEVAAAAPLAAAVARSAVPPARRA